MKIYNTLRLIFLILALCCFFVLGMLAQQRLDQRTKQTMASFNRRVGKLESLEPDVGDSMRELEYEMAKLWTAEKFHNPALARYELKEMKETVETVGILNPEVNGVNVAGVLDGMKNSQIAGMDAALRANDHLTFVHQYEQTLETCNECHRATGYGFNRITIPRDGPVPNQDWGATSAKSGK